MNEVKLMNLIDKIINEMEDPWIKGNRVNFTKDWMLKRLIITGDNNEHIPEFKILDQNECSMRNVEENNTLTGEEIIKGEYLVYWCCGHDGREVIEEFENLEDVESFILGFHDNSFINMILVFQNDEIKYWEVDGPLNTSEIVSEEIIDGITHSYYKTIIQAKVNWLN